MVAKRTSEPTRVKNDRMIHVRLPEELHRHLRVYVAEQDTTIQEWVSSLIQREIDRLNSMGHRKEPTRR